MAEQPHVQAINQQEPVHGRGRRNGHLHDPSLHIVFAPLAPGANQKVGIIIRPRLNA